MKGIYGPYFILMIHIITLTFRLYFTHIIDNVVKFDIPLNEINDIFNNFLSTDLVYDYGKIDLVTLINFFLFFLIGNNFSNSFIYVLMSIISMESIIIYYSDNPQIIINTISSILGYLIGLFINNYSKNKRHEIRYNNADDLLYEINF